jgi:hypothetical protein
MEWINPYSSMKTFLELYGSQFYKEISRKIFGDEMMRSRFDVG